MKLALNLVRVRPDRMPETARWAEELGYESVFVPDHLVFPVEFASKYPGTPDGSFPYPRDTPLYDPFIVMSTIASATSTIRVGTAIYIPALRHPILSARDVVTLDALAGGGRVILGVGVGWCTEEFEALGIDPRTRFSRTEESVDAMRLLWTEEQPQFHGRRFSFDRVHFEPKPAALPPILFGGESDAALRRALRFGDGWMSGGVAEDVEEIAATLGRLDAQRTVLLEEGDDRYEPGKPFDITVLDPAPSAAALERMAALGVDRVVVMPWASNREIPEAVERFRAMAASVVDLG